MPSSNIQVYDSKDALSQGVGQFLSQVLANPQDKFTVALSGGSVPNLLLKAIDSHKDSINFANWHVFFADERYVAHDHPDSNMKACMDAFLSKVPVPPEQIYGIDASVPVEEAAKIYEQQVRAVVPADNEANVPVFDLIILGMGPDGHTCSLFPGHELLQVSDVMVASIKDSPKPPPQRITLTYPVLNHAKNVIFLATGAGKVDVLPLATVSMEKLQELGEQALPAARVRPMSGNLLWFVDQDAAAKL